MNTLGRGLHDKTDSGKRSAQDVELTGRDNRTDANRNADFKGTLAQRRMQYQLRREAQGSKADKKIEEMRKEVGLAHADGSAVVPEDQKLQVRYT